MADHGNFTLHIDCHCMVSRFWLSVTETVSSLRPGATPLTLEALPGPGLVLGVWCRLRAPFPTATFIDVYTFMCEEQLPGSEHWAR